MKKRKLLTLTMASSLVLSFSAFAKPVANTYANDVTANSTEKAVDYKNLEDGVYSLGATIYRDEEHVPLEGQKAKLSMADGAIDKTKTRLVVKNGEYRVQLTFIPLTIKRLGKGFKGFLGNLRYDPTYNPVADEGSEPKDFGQCKILEWYGEKESNTSANATYKAGTLMKIYQQKFPDRKYYPKVLEYPINKNYIDKNGKIMTETEVFVPIMEAFGDPEDELGTQYCRPTF
ncbi:iron transport-associated domain protein, partial [Gemelliphila asaccharolytica]